jgi:hypothetical protein
MNDVSCRRELLTAALWSELLINKSRTPIPIDEAYGRIVHDQYNLGLIDREALRRSGTKWAWGQ